MKIERTSLKDLLILTPQSFSDERGYFMETYREDKLKDAGLTHQFPQDSHSHSVKGVVRGLHFQWEPPMGKLVRVAQGEAFFAIVDIRKNSSTFSKWIGIEVSADNKKQLFAPPGFAFGFCALSESVDVLYKQSTFHNQDGAGGILWNDSAIGIDWPISSPIISEKDASAETLDKWLERPESDLFNVPHQLPE